MPPEGLPEGRIVNQPTIALANVQLEHTGVLRTRQEKSVFVAEPSNDLTMSARK